VGLLKLQIAIGLLSIGIVFLLAVFFAARVAKKRGKNPWLWGSLTVVVMTALTWQYLPRWAGINHQLGTAAIRSNTNEGKMIPSDSPDTSATTQFILPAEKNTYTFHLPAAYKAVHSTAANLVRFKSKYPTMEASPGSRLGEGVLDVVVMTYVGGRGKARFFLDQVTAKQGLTKYAGKQGQYDVFQTPNKVTEKTDTSFVFTAKDGQLVLVSPTVFGHRAYRDITSDVFIEYGFFSIIGNDFIGIDEIVSDFVKARLNTQSIKSNANSK
jgi:hypothetical protein